MQAAVYEAKKWDTYVMGHSFSDEGSRLAVEAGFRSIEHGYGLTDETLELMKEAELLGYSGQLNPYQAGPIGVIKEGAYADLLLVDGNPLQDISLLADPEKNLKIIMKNGKIYKNKF